MIKDEILVSDAIVGKYVRWLEKNSNNVVLQSFSHAVIEDAGKWAMRDESRYGQEWNGNAWE